MKCFALAGLLARLTSALHAPLPLATNNLLDALDLYGFSPKPTEAPRSHLDLVRRAGAAASSGELVGWLAPDNTCGYVEGSIGAVQTCPSTDLCAAYWNQISSIGVMGCCETATTFCAFATECINYVGYYSSSLCDQVCQQDVNTMKWGEKPTLTRCSTDPANPYCYSFLIPELTVGWFSCAPFYTNIFVDFETTYIGEADGRTWSTLYSTASGAFAAATSRISSNIFSTPTSTATTSQPFITTSPVSQKSSSNAGAIAGGVIGGLVVVGAVVVGVVFLMTRRHKSTTGDATTPTPAVTEVFAPRKDPDAAANMGRQYAPQAPQAAYAAPVSYDPNDPRFSTASTFASPPDSAGYNPGSPPGSYTMPSPQTPNELYTSPPAPGAPMQPFQQPLPSPPPPPQQHNVMPQVVAPAPAVSPVPTGGQMPVQNPYVQSEIPPQLAPQYPTQVAQGGPIYEASAAAAAYQQGEPRR